MIEVMVAIAVFAVIAAGVYRVLSAMVAAQDRVVSHVDALADLQRSLWLMSMDMNQLVMRDVKKPDDKRSPALIADDGEFLLQFTRQGVRNPLLASRSDLERVAYSLGYEANDKAGGKKRTKSLLRHTWPALDRKEGTTATVQVLFRNVEDVRLEFLDQKGSWKSDWPEKKSDDREHNRALPAAIKLTMRTKDYGTLEQIYQVEDQIKKEKATTGEAQ